jgi:sortase (surface protein transpeptidase)
MSRRRAATGLVTGLVLMAAAPIVWWATQPAPAGEKVTTINAAAAVELASPSTRQLPVQPSTALATPSQPASSEPTDTDPTVTEPAVAEPPAPSSPPPAPAPAQPSPPAPPARIELPSLGVDTAIVPVGVNSDGLMDIPPDVSTVGWYRFGPAPGAAAGSAVLSGHVDDHLQGVGVFGRIGDLGPGDAVRIVDEAGVTRAFSVLSREEWSKGEAPLDRIFDRGGSSRLVLITCGGSFNSSTLGYDDNVAITAVPVGQ